MNYKISEIMEIIGGGTPKTSVSEYWNGEVPWLSVKDFNDDKKYVFSTEKTITQEGLKNSSACLLKENDIIISARGTVGALAMIPFPMSFNQSCYGLRADNRIVNSHFLYYLLKYKIKELQSNTHGTVFDTITRDTFDSIDVKLPDLIVQEKIASLLSGIDEKIYINSKINDNLLSQVMSLYKHIFKESNEERKTCRADEFFSIAIGKTPPRKERDWFSFDSSNVKWVSISDMGNCGVYIFDSSEYLVHEAVKKFNIAVIPENTVLLSFKLTVGRVAITDGIMTTNEAIAHFKTQDTRINPYLYCYLKDYNYQSLGSTSSIATAVNSKIIKAMPFIIPNDTELQKFNDIALPAFETIKNNQLENKRLTELRDSILPKLMSGEIDVSDIDL